MHVRAVAIRHCVAVLAATMPVVRTTSNARLNARLRGLALDDARLRGLALDDARLRGLALDDARLRGLALDVIVALCVKEVV